MIELHICQTHEPNPLLLEHWLMSRQNHSGSFTLLLQEQKGQVRLLVSESMQSLFPGSREVPCNKTPQPVFKFHASSVNGPLFPIKRFRQFEDRTLKERIHPMNELIHLMLAHPKSVVKIEWQALPDRHRKRILKRVKSSHFNPERELDRFESKAWFRPNLRSILLPLIRVLLPPRPPLHKQETVESFHEREEPLVAILDKLARPLFKVTLQSSFDCQGFLSCFSLPYLGQLETSKRPQSLILSAEELASLALPPNPMTMAEGLLSEPCFYRPAPPNPQHYSPQDAMRHRYLIGKTGMGKSTALKHFILNDAKSPGSLVVMDPHGDLVQDLFPHLQKITSKKLRVLDPSLSKFPIAFNPLELNDSTHAARQTAMLLEVFMALSQGSWGPRLEHVLRNSLYTLLLAPNTTLLDLPPLLLNFQHNQELRAHANDPELERFWTQEFWPMEERRRHEVVGPILNKVGPLLTNPILRNMVGQPKSTLKFTELFEEPSILLISLAKGALGEDQSKLLGMLLLTCLQSSLLRRSQTSSAERAPLFVTLDEFQNVLTPSLLSMLAESRKYGLALTLAHQYLKQVPLEFQDAILGNVSSWISFQVNPEDAETMAPLFQLEPTDLVQIPPHQAQVRRLQSGQNLPSFRWEVADLTNPPFNREDWTKNHQALARSQAHVEAKVKERYNRFTSFHAHKP